MREGQTDIRLYDPDRLHMATVLEITGAGLSLNKILRLQYKGEDGLEVVENVKHERDANDGEPYWMLKGEKRTRTKDEPEEPEAPDLQGSLTASEPAKRSGIAAKPRGGGK